MKKNTINSFNRKQKNKGLNFNLFTLLFSSIFFFSSSVFSQTQAPSITSGVTFQWSDNQNGGISNPATIQSITINGELFESFAVPDSYEMTRVGWDGPEHNHIYQGGSQIFGDSSNPGWDAAAIAAFKDKDLNHYFECNSNGDNVCNQFDDIPSSVGQIQSLYYTDGIPSNEGGILAVTERGGNNCYYIEMYGIPPGGGPEQLLGETFVRNSGNYTGCNFAPPINSNSDYWASGRCNENGQTIAIALFSLNDIAPLHSLITRVDLLAASKDHGDGKFFILQGYAVPKVESGCLNNVFQGTVGGTNNIPPNSTFSVVSGPTPAGQSFSIDPNTGDYTYVPTTGFVGDVVFEYEVCLPGTNQNICDTSTVTITYHPLPENPTTQINCLASGLSEIEVLSPLGANLVYTINGGTPQSSPIFSDLGEGTYLISVTDTSTACTSETATSVSIISNSNPPVAVDDSINVYQTSNVSVQLNILTNDSDIDGDNIFIHSISVPPSVGSVTIDNADLGLVTFTYNGSSQFTGTTFKYFVSDSGNYCSQLNQLDEATVTINVIDIIPRDCNCAPLYNGSNFQNPQLISGSNLSVGAIYRFTNVFPNNPYGTVVDALVRIEEFAGGASLTEIDETGVGIDAAFQPRINSTNTNDQSVLFNITFVTSGGTYGDEVDMSFFTTPFDIDSEDFSNLREYAEISLPDAYFVSEDTEIEIVQTQLGIKGIAKVSSGNLPGISEDPRYTFSNYFENKSSFFYRIGKFDGDFDRRYALVVDNANYNNPNSELITYPVICGNVSDVDGNALTGVNIDITGSDGSSQTVQTDLNGDYKGVAVIPEALVDVVYSINETDLTGYISVSDVDGANDNLITRTINLASTCGNDFVDGPELIISLDNKTDILCNGDDTGSITVSAIGGIPPLLFDINGGIPQASSTFNDLVAGNYIITVTDSLNNTDSIDVTISEPANPLSIVITKENATTAQGCQDGEATATPSGGTPPYTYLWSASAGSQTTATAINLPSGTHTVLVTDANGCELEQGVVIDCSNTCDAIISVDDITDVLCTGDNSGSATVSASSVANPSATFTFTWDNGQVDAGVTSSTISNVLSGIYTVSVTIDGTVCQPVEQSVTITEPASALNVTANATDENGPGTNDGTATAVASGGTPGYTYLWSPGGETTSTITGLAAGTYTVTVTDANGCTETATVTVNPGSCLDLTAFAVATPVTCNGDSDGTATATVTGGSGNVTYLWNTGATTSTITGLSGGSYSVTVTDTVTQCTSEATVTVNEPNVLDSGIAISHILCFGEATGSLDLTVTGGTPPYTFLWSTGATTEDLDDLVAGTYSVTITDANGCVADNVATINQPAVGLLLTFNTTDVLCNGASTGAIDIEVSGGTPDYTYVWSNGATTEDLINIPAGSYNVTVLDANGCSLAENNIVVSEPTNPISIVITKENATTAQGCQDGEATATPSGGTPPYTYLWSASAGSQTTATAINLPSGTHTVLVTDANGCELEQGVVIDCSNTCDAIISVDDITDVLCTGDNSGSATVSASSVANPSATFTFTWDNGQVDAGVTSSTISNVLSGIYTVSVTIDGTVCQPVEQSVTITEPASALNVTANATDENGPGTNDGTATAVASGGTPGYTYLWSPGGETTSTITGLAAGTYTVTVTDANGCTETATVTVNPGSCLDLTAFAVATPVTCNGDSDGTATATVTGGSGNVTYLWNTGATTSTITGLSGGSYSVTVTDTVTQCTSEATVTVNEPNVLDSGIAISHILCFGEATGSLDLTVTGGTPPYTFLWSTGATTEDLDDLVAGTYSVTITDANGCVADNVATINQPAEALTANITSQTDIVCSGLGSVTVEATGGTIPYLYNLDGGTFQSSGTFTDLETGDYIINILDANGCTEIVNFSILENCTDAINDINNTYVDTPVSGNVLTNDEDAEGDMQTVTSTGTITTAQGGTVVMNSDGSYTYTPPSGYTGPDSFDYSIIDDGNPEATDTATVYIEVLPENGSPNTTIANADTAGTEIDTPVDGNVLVNDVDPEGDNQEVTTVGTFPTDQGGTITIASDGSYTYTPPSGFTGEDTFTYEIQDDGNPQATDSAVLTITVNGNPLDNNTYANDDSYTGTPGATIAGNVLDNDSDPEGDTQTVNTTPVSGPNNGTVVLNTDGTFTYVPNDPNFVGTDSFVYEVCDSGSPQACDQATVYITVGGDPNTTDAINDINNTYVDTPVSGNVLTNDEDAEGDMQTVTSTGTITTAQGGTVVMNSDGSYTYTPPSGYTGPDSFDYSIIDDGNPEATDTATVYIEVLPIETSGNEPPIANADTASTEIDTPVTGNVLVNDFDQDGDNIVVTTTTVVTAEGVTVTIDPNTGEYTYTPPTGFTGVDTFEYTICDDGTPSLCDTTTVEITVVGNPLDNNTYANDDAYNGTLGEDILGNVLDNDTDPEGDTQTVNTTPVSGPNNGTVVLNTDGTFTYVPNDPNFVGTDSFVYEVCDSGSPQACDQATVYITVGEDNNEITAIDDINNTYINTSVSGDVSINDDNLDGPAGTETFTLVSGPTAGGTLVFNADGTYDYTPPTDFVGEDTFVYQICDGGSPQACDTATVTIQVVDDPIQGNDPPVANNDTGVTEINTPIAGNVLVNDYDLDGDPITVTTTTVVTTEGVTVTIDPVTGEYTYTPPQDFIGEDSFTYTICDNGNPPLCDEATVYIQVIGDNGNITVANDDAYYGEIDTPINGNVLDNDTDPEDDTQTVTSSTVTSEQGVTVTINSDGTFTYNPPAGYTGTDSFVYEIVDENGAVDQATVYILIGQTPAPAIALVKSGVFNDGNQNNCSDEGETITYTFTVFNEGNVPLNNISISDPLFESPNPVVAINLTSGDDNNDGILDVSETWVYTANYTLTTDNINTGSVTNQATVEGTDEDNTTVSDLSDDNSITENDPTITQLCQNGSMSVIKNQTGTGGGALGDIITYDIVVTNTGNTTLTDIVITDTNATNIQGSPITELLPGESETVTAEHTITQDDIDAGYVENVAVGAGEGPGGDPNDPTDDITDDSDTGTDTQGNTIPDPETVETEDGEGNTNGDPTDDPTVTDIDQTSSMSVIKNQTGTGGGALG
ncbi:MAG: Ig-like domain-containing protein, partial [Flavobacteriales bacterium]